MSQRSLFLIEGRGLQAAGGPSFIPRRGTAASPVPQTEFGNTVPHSQTTGTVTSTHSGQVTALQQQGCRLKMIVKVIISPDVSFVQKANILANSPASCQLFCKETPRSLEQQLQEHRYGH